VGLGGDAADIFQPFYTTKPTGLGMGLSISRSIIEGHGGQLRGENNPDQGATFWFTPHLKTGQAHTPLATRPQGAVHLGYLDDSRGLKDLQAEDAGFLPKPYTLESLAFEVAQALNRDA
jgi:hypothetical protein